MHPAKPGTAPTQARPVIPDLPLRTLRTDKPPMPPHPHPPQPQAPAAPATPDTAARATGKPNRDSASSSARRAKVRPLQFPPTGPNSASTSRPSTQPGGRRPVGPGGSIVVGKGDFSVLAIKDPSASITSPTKKPRGDGFSHEDRPSATARPDFGDEEEGAPGSRTFVGPKFYAPKNFNNAIVDVWPARRHSQTVSWTNDGPAPSAALAGSSAASPRGGARPPLLKAMEDYIHRESAMLEPAELANGGRLRIYREVLRIFAENFKTYGPVLQAVMAEYEAELARRRGVENRSLALELQLKAQQAEANEAIVEIEMKLANAKQTSEEERRIFDAFASESHTKQREADAVVREVFDEMNELQEERQQDLGKMLALVRAVKFADTRIKALQERNRQLKADLDQMRELRECLAESEAKLADLNNLYHDTIPRQQHERVVKELKAQLEKAREAEGLFRRVAAARGSAMERKNNEIESLRTREERRKRRDGTGSLTPRPDLSAERAAHIDRELLKLHDHDATMTTAARVTALADRLEQEQARVKELEAAKLDLEEQLAAKQTAACAPHRKASQTTLLPRLLPHAYLQALQEHGLVGIQEQRTGAAARFAAASSPSVFGSSSPQAIGDFAGSSNGGAGGANVMPFLRLLGSVPRVEAKRTDLAHLLGALLEFRRRDRATEPDFGTSVFRFFAQRAAPKAACARAANFFENCQRFRFTDPRLELFLGVLDGVYPEILIDDVFDFVEEYRREVRALAGPDQSKRVRRHAFMEVIGRKLLDYKSDEARAQLGAALGRDPSLDVDELTQLQHPFLEALVVQGCDERIDLYTRLVAALTAAAGPDGMLTHDDVRTCVATEEPDAAEETVIELCRPDPLATRDADDMTESGTPQGPAAAGRATIALSLVLERLCTVPIQRVGAE